MALAQVPNTMRKRMRKGLAITLTLLFLSALCFLLLFARAGQDAAGLLIGLGIVLFVIAVPIALETRWSHKRAEEIDDILAGKDRLAYWSYPVNDEQGSREGSVYIGWQGTYLDHKYFHYQEKNRRLERAYLVKQEPLGTLRLICRKEVTPSSEDRGLGKQVHYPSIAIPVPPAMYDIAENIVDQYVEKFNLKTVQSGE